MTPLPIQGKNMTNLDPTLTRKLEQLEADADEEDALFAAWESLDSEQSFPEYYAAHRKPIPLPIQGKTMTKKPRKPSPVARVERALLINAKERAADERADENRMRAKEGLPPLKGNPAHHWMVSCFSQKNGESVEWLLGASYEGGSSMVFQDGEWSSRASWSGEDTPMKHGIDEAFSSASIWFTG